MGLSKYTYFQPFHIKDDINVKFDEIITNFPGLPYTITLSLIHFSLSFDFFGQESVVIAYVFLFS